MQIDEVMALVDEYVSASIEDHGYRSGAASAEYLEDTKRKLLAAIAALIAAPAAPQQAEPVAWMAFGGALVHAVTRNAMDPIEAERFDVPLYLHPPAAPQQAEPVEQIGWSDEFGNLFPMGAWKPAQRTHHDSHKAAWRPVFLHPPAAEVQTAPKVIRNDDGNYVIEGSPPAGPLLDALLAQCELKAEAQRLRDAASALCGALTASELNDMAYHALNALRRCVKGANDATN